jgi:hypothetical protein
LDPDDVSVETNHKGGQMGVHRSNFIDSSNLRSLVLKTFITSLLPVFLLACGNSNLQTVTSNELSEDESCLNCGLAPEPEHEVSDSAGYAIDVFPMEMTFFLDEMPTDLHVVEPLQITNTSRDTITLLAGDLFQSNDALDRTNSGTFELINPAIFPVSLTPGETLTMTINYRPDTDQSAGLVVIATNHPAQPFLFVSVIGKVFL